MSGNRILWGQITLVLAVVLATTWIATQWTACRLGFQPQLGQPWFELGQGMPVYYPPAFFWWWYAYDAYAPSVFIAGAFIAASGGFIAVAAAYNPLLEVRRGDKEVRDVQNIADILVDPEGALDRRNHWEKTSHSLLVGAILHVLYAEPDKTLAGVANFLSDPKRPVEATLRAMMSTPHLGKSAIHPVVASAAP